MRSRGDVIHTFGLRAEKRAAKAAAATKAATEEDWKDLFYLLTFLNLRLHAGQIERREEVWIRRFLASRGKHQLYPRMQSIIERGACDAAELEQLSKRAALELSKGEKRRFVYDVAQLCQAQGSLSTAAYVNILEIAENVGVSDVEADSIVHSVYTLNDSVLALVGVLALGAVLYFAQAVIVPLVVAIFITMIIYRVERLITSALGIRRFRWLTKLAATIAILAGFFGLAVAAVASGTDIVNRFPDYAARFEAAVNGSAAIQSALVWLRGKGLLEQLHALPIGSMLASFLGSLFTLLGNFALVAVFTGFMVFSSSEFKGTLEEMSDKIGTYMTIHTLMCLLTGLGVFVLCRAFGVDFALFWGLLAFLLNYIPSVGSIIATVPLMLLSMIQLDSWTAIAVFIVLLEALQLLIGQVLEPKLMGNRLALKPLAILLGLIFWGLIWGIPGMFLAIPLMVLMKILSSYFNVSRGFERLISSEAI